MFDRDRSFTPSPIRGRSRLYIHRYLILGLALLCSLSSWAQLEPCGFYELDGKPGFGDADLHFVADAWRDTGTYPDIPDHNGDGSVNLLDMVAQVNCVPDLAPGLAASYYGFDTGASNQEFDFPDFAAITFEPTVVNATDRLEEFDGRNGFLNSDMRDNFAVAFEGYLFVPENANYTLEISGREGMRVNLNGNQILQFDGNPRNDSTTLPLTYGLHPIRIEQYVQSNGQATFTWSSNGTVIGPTNAIIGPDYLYHPSEQIPQHAVSELDVVFDPLPGSRATAHRTRVQAWIRGADSQITFHFQGEDKVLYDGKMDEEIPLTAGLNPIPYTITDSQGNSTEGIYDLYWDAVPAMQPGLNVNHYAVEYYEGTVPDVTDLQPFRHYINSSTQMIPDNDGNLFMNGQFVPGFSVTVITGVIRIQNPGVHEFRISDGSGALFINGRQLLGRNYDYPGQYNLTEEIDLPMGRHHYRLVVGRTWGSPAMRVFWTRPGQSETLINDSYFLYNPAETILPPNFSNANGTGSREGANQVAEYVFQPGAPFADTAGKGFDLLPDNRATPRPNGGITYESPGALQSFDAGVHLVERIKQDGNFSLEIDFVNNDDLNGPNRYLMGLTYQGTRLVSLYTNGNDIRFYLRDQNGDSNTVEASNVLTTGNRFHVLANFNGGAMHLYVNGVRLGNASFFAELDRWPAAVRLEVGQGMYRRDGPSIWGGQLYGSFLVAGAYNRRLGPSSVTDNMAANATITPTPGPMVYPLGATFPPAGTTQAEFDEAFHILNRLSFGPSPETLNEIINTSVDAWITQQMDPYNIDDSAFEQEIEGRFIPTRLRRDLQGETIYRMARSKRQLLEVMTWFWENHFNTEVGKTRDLLEEYQENFRFRDLAFGDFAQLLQASAMNYPMTVYLDSDSNVVGAPNENYAREILELHTFGVNNGYTQQDIVEAARCFTGWTIRNGRFYFNPGLHDYGPKSLLGLDIPAGGGLSDGIAVINHITNHPNTADFIAWKLCQYFVADDPPASIHSAVANTFNSSNGDIAQTLLTLFNHADFRTDPDNRGNKLKTPLEFALSMFRATDMSPLLNATTWYLDAMGMELFNYADPTGFPEESVAWLDTNSLSARWNMINDFTTNRRNSNTPAINYQAMTARYNWHSFGEVLDTFENLTSHGTEPAGVRANMEQWLTDGNPGAFVLDDETLDQEVRQTLGLYFRLSEFNKQ